MNIFLNEYSGFCFELKFELNHFKARFNEKMNFQNVSPRATPNICHNHDILKYIYRKETCKKWRTCDFPQYSTPSKHVTK